MIEFPLLSAHDIECRISQTSAKGASVLLYKDARVDMRYLDAVFGVMGWECDYKEIKGNLYCGITVEFEGKKVTKWDCGVESRDNGDGNNKKGEASDAFKRAGTKIGIGRELYTAPFIWIGAECFKLTDKNGQKSYKDRLEVVKITYDGREIESVTIVNRTTGEIVYGNSARKPGKQENAEATRPKRLPNHQFYVQMGVAGLTVQEACAKNPVGMFELTRNPQCPPELAEEIKAYGSRTS